MTQAYPLQWPENWKRTPPHRRKGKSRFNTTFTAARDHLMSQLRLLGAKHAVVSSWLALRSDGLPLASQARMKSGDPGVAVYFELRGRPMVMARDEYDTVHDNLRSIGLALDHLRGMERHGGAAMMERAFEGFAALPAPGSADPFVTLGVARNATEDEINYAFREKSRQAHPDTGGSHEAMAQLTVARSMALKIRRAA